MNVAFGEGALSNPEAHRYLTEIFWMFVDGRHHWAVEDDAAIKNSSWFRGEGERNQREIRDQLRYAKPHLSGHGSSILVSDKTHLSNPAWELTPKEAVALLHSPVEVFVENLVCDGTFFRLVMLRAGEKTLRRRLGSDVLAQLKKSWTTEAGDGCWFRVNHGGGNTLISNLGVAFRSPKQVPLSILCIVDSDKKYPADSLGQTAQGVQQAFQQAMTQYNITSWKPKLCILQKREVENYIPQEALRRELSPAAYGAYCQLNELQRDYYDLKNGFSKALQLQASPSNPTWTDPQEQTLYQSLQAQDLNTLCKGFGRNIGRALQKHFDLIHAASLRERAGEGGKELDDIVDMALGLL